MIGFVVATRRRPKELERLLESLRSQTNKNFRVVVVESGGKNSVDVVEKFRGYLDIEYYYSSVESSTVQRNLGVEKLLGKVFYVGFLDDDAVVYPDAVENFFCWENELKGSYVGFGFNLVNHPQIFAESLKKASFTEKLGLYSNYPGKVAKSGFQSMIGRVNKLLDTEWLPSGAVVWDVRVFEKCKLDPWFSDYGYLEDLDFSYGVYKSGLGKLCVLPDCLYEHHPAPSGRGSGFKFGKREVFNRLYFVRKHKGFCMIRAYIALFLRSLLSFYFFLTTGDKYFLGRFFGSMWAIMMSI